MRTFQAWSCLLLASILLVIPSCSQSAYVMKGSEVETDTVKISNCTATPDMVKVKKNAQLKWTLDPPDGHTYTIQFTGRKPISSATPPIGQDQTVIGKGCIASFDWWCHYEYDLIKDANPPNNPGTKCPDPGVHVGPGG